MKKEAPKLSELVKRDHLRVINMSEKHLTHASLFSGIGGFDYAAKKAGIKNIFQIEIDEFCRKVLNKNFPDVEKYKDIKEFKGNKYYGAIDIISGGFPCQPFSIAGKRKGSSDDRFLWNEMLRVIHEIKPKWVIAENVPGLLSIESGLVFKQTKTDLEDEGYEVQTFIIPACAVDAPHRRDRVWIIAYDSRGYYRESIERQEQEFRKSIIRDHIFTNSNSIRGEISIKRKFSIKQMFNSISNKRSKKTEYFRFTKSPIRGRDDGIPRGLDRSRIKALGNSIHPEIAYRFFEIIKVLELKI